MTDLQFPPLFSQFLVAAKTATYAAGDNRFEVKALLPGAHQLDYPEGKLLYRDIYYGGYHFAGMETVFADQTAIWAMSYYGGFTEGTDPDAVGDMGSVLKAALRQIPLQHPYRGPAIFCQDDYVYTNDIRGSLAKFSGTEQIYHGDAKIYQLAYSGGLIR